MTKTSKYLQSLSFLVLSGLVYLTAQAHQVSIPSYLMAEHQKSVVSVVQNGQIPLVKKGSSTSKKGNYILKSSVIEYEEENDNSENSTKYSEDDQNLQATRHTLISSFSHRYGKECLPKWSHPFTFTSNKRYILFREFRI